MEGTTNRAKKNPQTDPEKNPQIFLHPLSIRGVTRFNLLLEYKFPQFDNPRAGLTFAWSAGSFCFWQMSTNVADRLTSARKKNLSSLGEVYSIRTCIGLFMKWIVQVVQKLIDPFQKEL